MDATAVKRTGSGAVKVTVLHKEEVVYRKAADKAGEAAYLIYDTSELES